MINDRFNEMYLKIVKAKGFDTKGNTRMALKIYLEIIEDYIPSDDFVYKRACEILAKQGEYKSAKKFAMQALKKIKEAELSGSSKYFVDFISKMEEKESLMKVKKNDNKNNNKFNFSINFLEKKINFIFIILLFLFFIIISLPDKIFKMLFLISGIISIIFVFEIYQDLKKRLSVKIKGFMFLLSLCISLIGVYNMPPSNWNQFFEFQAISEIHSKVKTEKMSQNKEKIVNNKQENATSNQIRQEDLDLLKELNQSELNLSSYKIICSEDSILLDLKLKAGASKNEGKQIAINILSNLNTIKGFKVDESSELGKIYDKYIVNVKIRNYTKELIARGKKTKNSKKIKW